MKFILPKEMIPELLSGKIKDGSFEDQIEFEHDGKTHHIALKMSEEEEIYFAKDDILCDIEYYLYNDTIFIDICVPEYTFRQLLMGNLSLEEVLNKQRGYILAGQFRPDEEYKLVIK